jgi:hypothetical protein
LAAVAKTLSVTGHFPLTVVLAQNNQKKARRTQAQAGIGWV